MVEKNIFFMIEININKARIIKDYNKNIRMSDLEFKSLLFESLIEKCDIAKKDMSINNYIPIICRDIHNMVQVKGANNRCVFCYINNKISKTNVKCIECGKYLHPDCFLEYHKNYIYNKNILKIFI